MKHERTWVISGLRVDERPSLRSFSGVFGSVITTRAPVHALSCAPALQHYRQDTYGRSRKGTPPSVSHIARTCREPLPCHGASSRTKRTAWGSRRVGRDTIRRSLLPALL